MAVASDSRQRASGQVARRRLTVDNRADSSVNYERVIVDNLSLIDGIVRFIARRHGLSADEADDLKGAILLKLVDNDYEVLRRFEERSNLRTYLTTVIQRHFLDARRAEWGKWRPSAQARRLGPVAILLDQLLTRDGLPFDEAVQIINSRHIGATRDALHAIMIQLPQRTPRRFVGDEGLDHIAGSGGGEQEVIESIDRASNGDRINQALTSALSTLAGQDRLILKMRYLDDLRIVRISHLLSLPQKPLYRRIEEIKKVLRRELEARGVSQADVDAIVGNESPEVELALRGESAGKGRGRPSQS
jgi:RNA polymerase sigma factor for flagellar operon FliA